MPDKFGPTTIEDLLVRQIIIFLLNWNEKQTAQIQAQSEEIQRLPDEIIHL